jgi:5-methyltetrahydropteroyltriglutamate--homocysteine methyltransferase
MTKEQFRPPNHEHDHFLMTTVVGSYPKPKWLHRARDLYEGGELTRAEQHGHDPRDDEDREFDRDDWAEAKDDASRLIVDEHERAGLDVVVDGEMRRAEMVEHFAAQIDGYEFNGPVKVWGHNYFHKPSVVSKLEYVRPWLREEYEFTASVADAPVKVPITGPYTLARWSFNEAYDSTEALAHELADLVNREVEGLVEAGARYVQIDEPALAQHAGDHAIVGECLERIADGIPDEVRLGLHVCYGDYSRIYPEILEFPVDEFDVELVNGDYEKLDVFTDPEFTKDLALGVVDVHDATVESVAEIKANIQRGFEVVPPERLVVSPDCGLKLLPREAAFEKMSNMVRAAREVERELDAGEIEVTRRPVGAD